jgi:ribosome maturation factor RimP
MFLVVVMSDLIVEKVKDYLADLLLDMGLELFDVQFRPDSHGWVLRVFIDSSDGISLDQCSVVSRELGQYLDVEEVIDRAYNLEVSSPGLERPLRSIAEFSKYTGKKSKVKVHNAIDGVKTFEGVIGDVGEEIINMTLADGSSMQFTYDMLSKARLAI